MKVSEIKKLIKENPLHEFALIPYANQLEVRKIRIHGKSQRHDFWEGLWLHKGKWEPDNFYPSRVCSIEEAQQKVEENLKKHSKKMSKLDDENRIKQEINTRFSSVGVNSSYSDWGLFIPPKELRNLHNFLCGEEGQVWVKLPSDPALADLLEERGYPEAAKKMRG